MSEGRLYTHSVQVGWFLRSFDGEARLVSTYAAHTQHTVEVVLHHNHSFRHPQPPTHPQPAREVIFAGALLATRHCRFVQAVACSCPTRHSYAHTHTPQSVSQSVSQSVGVSW